MLSKVFLLRRLAAPGLGASGAGRRAAAVRVAVTTPAARTIGRRRAGTTPAPGAGTVLDRTLPPQKLRRTN